MFCSVFYDFKTTQYTKFSEIATQHVPNFVCLEQFCSQCENESDTNVDCRRCGKRMHSFFDDPVRDLLTYFCRPRAWCEKVVAVAHNAKAFDTQFILDRAIFLNSVTQVIINDLKVVFLRVKHLTFMTVPHIWLCHYASCPKPSAWSQNSPGTLITLIRRPILTMLVRCPIKVNMGMTT
jgi:hypothetical protein